MSMEKDEIVDRSREIYERSCVLWNELSPNRGLIGGSPGIPDSFNAELGYIEAAISALEGVRNGMMERAFPKMKDVRLEQERFWDDRLPGLE